MIFWRYKQREVEGVFVGVKQLLKVKMGKGTGFAEIAATIFCFDRMDECVGGVEAVREGGSEGVGSIVEVVGCIVGGCGGRGAALGAGAVGVRRSFSALV